MLRAQLNKEEKQIALLNRIKGNGVLDSQDLERFVFLQQQCQNFGLNLGKHRLLIGLLGDHPSFLADILSLQFEIIEQDDPLSGLMNVKISPEDEAQLLKECQADKLVQEEDIEKASDIQEKLKIMGISLCLAEILLLKHKIPEEKLTIFSVPWGKHTEFPKITFKNYLVKPTDFDPDFSLGKCAVLNGLLSEESLLHVLSIRDRLKREYSLDVPLERLLFEMELIDRRHLESLSELQIRYFYKVFLKENRRCRLSLKDDSVFEEKCKQQKKVSEEKIKKARKIQNAISKIGFLVSICEILVSMGALTLKDLDSLGLPDDIQPKLGNETPKMFSLPSSDTSEEEVMLQSGIISREDIDACIDLKKHFESTFAFSLPLTRWLTITCKVNDATLNNIIIAKALAQSKGRSRYAYLRFSPDEETFMEKTGRDVCKSHGFPSQKELQDMGVSWKPCELMLMQGGFSREEMEKLLEHRQVSCFDDNFSFPDWLYKEQSLTISSLAVANHYITQEEALECISIQNHCQSNWTLHLPLELIFLKKEYMTPHQIKKLIQAYFRNEVYSQWSRYYHTLSLPKNDEQEIMERIRHSPMFSDDFLRRQENIHKAIQTHGLNISMASLLIISNPIVECLTDDIVKRHLRDIGWQRNPVTGQIARPHSSRQGVLPELTYRLDKMEKHLLKDHLLGQIAIQEGLLSLSDLNDTLFVQSAFNELGINLHFGDLLVDMGYLSRDIVDVLVSLQNKRLGEVNWPRRPFLSDEDYLLCQTIIEYNTVPHIEMKRGLYIQSELQKIGRKVPLVSILERMGGVDKSILQGQIRVFKKHIEMMIEPPLPQDIQEVSPQVVLVEKQREEKPAIKKRKIKQSPSSFLKPVIATCLTIFLSGAGLYSLKAAVGSSKEEYKEKSVSLQALNIKTADETKPHVDVTKGLFAQVSPSQKKFIENPFVVEDRKPDREDILMYKGEWVTPEKAIKMLQQERLESQKINKESPGKIKQVKDTRESLPDTWYLYGTPDLKFDNIKACYIINTSMPFVHVEGVLSDFIQNDREICLDLDICPVGSPLDAVVCETVRVSKPGLFDKYISLPKPLLPGVYHVMVSYDHRKQGRTPAELTGIWASTHYTMIPFAVGEDEEIEILLQEEARTIETAVIKYVYDVYRELQNRYDDACTNQEKSRSEYGDWASSWARRLVNHMQNLLDRRQSVLILPFPKTESCLRKVLADLEASSHRLEWEIFNGTFEEKFFNEEIYEESFRKARETLARELHEKMYIFSLLKNEKSKK